MDRQHPEGRPHLVDRQRPGDRPHLHSLFEIPWPGHWGRRVSERFQRPEYCQVPGIPCQNPLHSRVCLTGLPVPKPPAYPPGYSPVRPVYPLVPAALRHFPEAPAAALWLPKAPAAVLCLPKASVAAPRPPEAPAARLLPKLVPIAQFLPILAPTARFPLSAPPPYSMEICFYLKHTRKPGKHHPRSTVSHTLHKKPYPYTLSHIFRLHPKFHSIFHSVQPLSTFT